MVSDVGSEPTPTFVVSGVGCPPPYEDTVDVEEWLADLEDYFLGKYGDLTDARKLAILRRVVGESHIGTVKELISRLTPAEREVYATVKAAIINHFGKSRSVIVERHQLH